MRPCSIALFLSMIIGMSAPTCTRSKKAKKKTTFTIIFELSGVLFRENMANLTRKLGIGSLASYTITHWKNPATVCLNMLENMGKEKMHKSPVTFIFKEKVMPHCIVEWQKGQKACGQVQKEVDDYIEKIAKQNYFSSVAEKTLTQNIISIIFNSQQMADLIKPIVSMAKLAKQLKKAGYKLLILANMPQELYNIVSNTYPEIIELFDGSIISCQAHKIKPEKQIFEQLLHTYQLKPDACILIDEREESIATAKKLGMTGIAYKKAPTLIKKLKRLGVEVH